MRSSTVSRPHTKATCAYSYGSLLAGLHNHGRMNGCTFVGPARTADADFFMVSEPGSGVCVHAYTSLNRPACTVHTAQPIRACGSGYPFALRPGDGRPGITPSSLVGELYRAPRKVLEGALDALEGHPSFYRRELANLRLEVSTNSAEANAASAAAPATAWVYFLSDPHLLLEVQGDVSGATYPEVPRGDWRPFFQEAVDAGDE
jgi:gamma-glutamylcyclotransferase (GGCT)/AIG2-like uncharacterized protein YtfP